MKRLSTALLKLLQGIQQPLYFLDEAATIVFCNKALEEWTGCETEKLIGQNIRYRFPASRLKHEIIAASLSPPPEVWTGHRIRSPLLIDQITKQSQRSAEFIPLLSAGLLVIVDHEDVAGTGVSVSSAESKEEIKEFSQERQAATELHQTLYHLRRRQVGRYRWDRMVGASPQMQRVRRQARLAVDSQAAVLILGEKGTGKEHLASAVHYGPYSTSVPENIGSLIKIDCSLCTEELTASTLLMFRKRFQKEETDKRHTLLLKDAELFPTSLQPLLSEFFAANAPHQRIIASSTLPISEWDPANTLPILLGTILIELPALRFRKEEVPLLSQFFLEEKNAQSPRPLAGFTSETLDFFSEYQWPGNIDELETLVGQAFDKAVSGPATLISFADLPDRLHYVADAADHPISLPTPIHLESFLRDVERELVERTLAQVHGNKTKAAELLGLSRPSLYRRMVAFGMIVEDHT